MTKRSTKTNKILKTGGANPKNARKNISGVEKNDKIADELKKLKVKIKNINLKNEAEREVYTNLFENSPAAYVKIDDEGIVQEANSAFLIMFSVEFPNIIKKSIIDWTQKNDRTAFYLFLKRLAAAGTPRIEDFKFLDKNNLEIIANVKGVKLNISGRRKNEYLLIFNDITSIIELNSELNEKNKIIEKILNSAPLPIAVTNTHGLIIDCNDVFLELSGETNKEELLNGDFLMRLSESSLSKVYSSMNRTLEKGAESEVEFLLKRKGLSSIPIKCSLKLISDIKNNPKYFIWTFNRSTHVKKNEINLRGSEEFFYKMIENLPVTVFVKEAKNYSYVLWNKELERIYGISESDALGKTDYDIYPKEIADEIRKRDVDAMKSGDILDIPFINIKTKDKRTLSLHTIRVPIFNELGEPAYLLGFSEDITERVKNEEELKKLSSAVEQSSASVIITDKSGNIEYVNKRFCQATGYSFEEVYGRNPRLLKSGQMPPDEYKKLWTTISSGKEWKGEFHNKKKNGDLFWETALISPIRNSRGETINYLAIKEDITDKKKIEQELILAKEKAEESNKLKTSLLSNLNHEFRTPMTGILGSAEILKDEISDPKQLELIKNIQRSGWRLMNTLNSILELSQLEALQLHEISTEIDISENLALMLEDNVLQAEEKGLQFNLEIKKSSIIIFADKHYLKQAINNIIDNAIKFTNKGEISVVLEELRIKDKNWCSIIIKDTGIGIDLKQLDNIFTEFRQISEGYGRNYEGAGLGLTITKKIIEQMGGRIIVESQLNRGSIFTLMIPVYLSKTRDESKKEGIFQNASIVMDSNRLKVLLVEDNLINRYIVKTYLKDLCEIICAINGEEAFEKVEKEDFDLVLADINLGVGMDGIELCEKIKNIKNIPVIAVTGYSLPNDRERLIAKDFEYYLAKPFKKRELLEAVQKTMKKTKGKAVD